jgi:hypothetical protein
MQMTEGYAPYILVVPIHFKALLNLLYFSFYFPRSFGAQIGGISCSRKIKKESKKF